jgi:iron complex outermembrane receptor protein
MVFRYRCTLVCLLFCVCATVQAAATPVLEEVIVTATRIPLQWSRIALAVGEVGQDDIQLGRQQLGLDESLVNIPGLFLQNRYNFAQDIRIAIRGFGARANFGIRGIKLFADDIPLTMPDGQGNVDSLDLGSAKSIEVIRGPVSAMYGSAGGGVINIATEDGPPTPFLSARFSLGAYDYRLAQVKTGGQAGPLNWFVNLSDTELDGYRRQSRYERSLLNSKIRYDLDESSSLTVVFNATDSPTAQDPGALTRAEVQADRRQAAARNVQFDTDEIVQQEKLGVVWRKTVNTENDLLLRSYAIQRDFQGLQPFVTNSNGQGGYVDLDRKVAGIGGHWSWNKPLASAGENRLVLGFDLDRQRDLRKRYANDNGIAGALTTSQDEDLDTRSLFLEDAWIVSPHLALTVGARLDDIKYQVTDRTAGNGSGDTSFSRFSPMASVAWSRNDRLNVYGNISTSFDPPAITELANPEAPTGFNRHLGPQTATNYELGTKGWFSDRLRYELALFHIDVRDEIVPFELTGTGQSFYRNAGASTHDGVEAGLSLEPLPGFTIGAAYTWSDFRFETYSEPGGNVYDGNRIPGVPEHQFHVDLAWQPASGFYAGGDLLYVGSFFADNANTVETSSYLVANLRTGYRWLAGHWELQPFVGISNLFDEHYIGNVRINATFGRYYEPAPERNVYGGVELKFDF